MSTHRLAPAANHLLRLVIPGYGERLGRTLWTVFVARLINAIALNAAFPFIAAYLARDRGVPAVAIGALYMAQGVVGGGFQLVGGALADRFGRRTIIVSTLAARAAVLIAIGLVIRAEAPIAVLAAFILLNATLFGLFQPAADALTVDATTPDTRIAAFAHQRVAINAGWAAGPALGGIVATQAAFETVFFGAAPLVLLGAFVFSRLQEPPRAQSTRRDDPFAAITTALSDPALRLQLLGALLVFVLAGQMVVTLSVDGTERLGLSTEDLGLLWSVNGLLVVFAQMPVARLVRVIGPRTALLASSLIYAVAYAAVGFAWSLPALIACMVGITAGELLNSPSQQTAIASRAPAESMGQVLGLLGLTMVVGRSLGPLVGGAAHDLLGGHPQLMWAAIGAVGLAAAAVYAHPRLKAPGRDG